MTNITLPPDIEELIQDQIANGNYQSAIEVISAGIRLLAQQDDLYQGRFSELQRDVVIGWEAAQRGELLEGSEAIEQIRANLRSHYSSTDS